MAPQIFLFFGRSGSGKGTQADLLIKHLKENDPTRNVVYVETGQRVRDFIAKGTYSSKLVSDIVNNGGLLPAFFPVWLWSSVFVENIKGNEHLVLDGLSRRDIEAPVLASALEFYGFKNPQIIVINVSKDWAKARLLSRKRADDSDEKINRRLGWFDEQVIPAIQVFRDNPAYSVFDIEGEQPIEKVHQDILTKLRL